jgi:hypothetical protein
MRTIGRIFDSHAEATSVADALVSAGVVPDNITVIGPPRGDLALSSVPTIGMTIGATAGLLIAISLAVNGVLPVGGRWLTAAIAGAVTGGGIAGGLLGMAWTTKPLSGRHEPQAVYLVLAEVDEDGVSVAEMALILPAPSPSYTSGVGAGARHRGLTDPLLS